VKPGGKVVILEFSKPSGFPFRQLYNFYFKFVLPKIGRLVSHDQTAYTYLPESVQAFPYGNDFLKILLDIGYKKTTCRALTFGISSLYTGIK
jgi:demethylmenaquinone methyltransferase/2-methoxy-6-polyprenyl-1,4-benzoquinol methylase